MLGQHPAPRDRRRSYRANRFRRTKVVEPEVDKELVEKLANYSREFRENIYQGIRERADSKREGARRVKLVADAVAEYQRTHNISDEMVDLTARY